MYKVSKMSGMQNCSLCEECITSVKTETLVDQILIKLCELLIITIVVMTMNFINAIVFTEFTQQRLKLSDITLTSNSLIQILALSVLILTLPFITVLITIALLYKVLCSIAIRRKDKRFVKFLDSFDVFCCLEDNNTIDVQGVIQSNTVELALDKIKEKLNNVFINYGKDKMFYRRNEEYGFYYWRRYSHIDLAQYVQIVEVPDHDQLNIKQDVLEKSRKDKITYKDEGLFKVLIIKNRDGDNDKENYKIILKFDNSVKDNALLEFVARLVEKADDCHVAIISSELKDYESPDALINMITKLFGILGHSLDGIKRAHNLQNSLNKMKILDWTKSDENLLCIVNDVIDNARHLNLFENINILDKKLHSLRR